VEKRFALGAVLDDEALALHVGQGGCVIKPVLQNGKNDKDF
jgi:hypothetical protein